MPQHEVVSREAWLEARRALLAREKAFTHQRDELSAARRALPWVRIDKPYLFEGPNGKLTLPQLFAGLGQLVVYHLMFAPEWEVPCKSCSFWADSFNGITVHLEHRDVTMVAISRAPYPKLEAFARRLGWTFPWYSSQPSDFNYDFQVSFTPAQLSSGDAAYNYEKLKYNNSDMPGVSVFAREGDSVFHTYSCFARGIDALNTAYQCLDLVPKGRDEGSPPMSWVRHRDRYDR